MSAKNSTQVAKNRRRALKAFGLVEVLISIAISAVVLLGALSVSARAYIVVRENEVRDNTSNILLRSLEVARSPLDLGLNSLTGRQTFRLNDTGSGFELQSTGSDAPINSCTSQSNYLVVTPDPALQICNQIIITPLTPTATKRSYEVKSIAVYDFAGRTSEPEELTTYRTEI